MALFDGTPKPKRWFPLNFEKFRGIPINAHPGAFGCARKYNFHEGIDLYGSTGDMVRAIREGVVVSNARFTGASEGHPWWLETDAVLIKDDEGYYVYGEILSSLKKGDKISVGDIIGKLVPVLPPEKHRPDIPAHSVTMLHLERWNLSYDESTGWSSWSTRNERPDYLEDPTLELVEILKSKKINPNFLTY